MSFIECHCRQFGPEVLAGLGQGASQPSLILADSSGKESRPKSQLQRRLLSVARNLDIRILKFTSKICKWKVFDEEKKKTKKQYMDLLFSWTNIALLVIVYSTLGLLRTLYHHYAYDYYVFNLERLHRIGHDDNQSLWLVFKTDNMSRLEQHLKGQLKRTRQSLLEAGTFMSSAPAYSAECCYITVLAIALLAFYSLNRTVCGGQLNTNFIRLLRDPLEEQRRLQGFVLQEANKCLASNWTFNQCYLAWRCSGWNHLDCLPEVEKLAHDYEQNILILRTILMRASIVRLHSFSPSRLDHLALFHCFSFIGINLLYVGLGLLLIVYLGSLLPAAPAGLPSDSAGLDGDENNTKEASVLGSSHLIIMILSFVFVGVSRTQILVIDWLDEIELMRRLEALMSNCVHVNERILHADQNSGHEESRTLEWTVNSNLLLVLMNYKIFPLRARQSALNQHTNANVSLRVMFILPIVIKLHAPYCSPGVLLQFVAICHCISAFATLAMLMSCHLNERTVRLHRPLASLLGHVVHMNHINSKRSVYSQHSVWYLRQELANLRQFQEPCMLPPESTLSVRFSFAVLIKVHFWFNLLLLSIFAHTKNGGPSSAAGGVSSTDQLLRDPFGLFGD